MEVNRNLLEDYLNDWMPNKSINILEYEPDEEDKTIIVTTYSYRFETDEVSYTQITGIRLIDLMGFIYSKIKNNEKD